MAKPPGNDGTGAKSHLAMVEAAMMEELGNQRVNSLPADDRGNRGPSVLTAVPKPKPRNAAIARWQAVQFDDEDARGVEGLDNLGDGLLHRMKSLTTGQSFGVRVPQGFSYENALKSSAYSNKQPNNFAQARSVQSQHGNGQHGQGGGNVSAFGIALMPNTPIRRFAPGYVTPPATVNRQGPATIRGQAEVGHQGGPPRKTGLTAGSHNNNNLDGFLKHPAPTPDRRLSGNTASFKPPAPKEQPKAATTLTARRDAMAAPGVAPGPPTDVAQEITVSEATTINAGEAGTVIFQTQVHPLRHGNEAQIDATLVVQRLDDSGKVFIQMADPRGLLLHVFVDDLADLLHGDQEVVIRYNRKNGLTANEGVRFLNTADYIKFVECIRSFLKQRVKAPAPGKAGTEAQAEPTAANEAAKSDQVNKPTEMRLATVATGQEEAKQPQTGGAGHKQGVADNREPEHNDKLRNNLKTNPVTAIKPSTDAPVAPAPAAIEPGSQQNVIDLAFEHPATNGKAKKPLQGLPIPSIVSGNQSAMLIDFDFDTEAPVPATPKSNLDEIFAEILDLNMTVTEPEADTWSMEVAAAGDGPAKMPTTAGGALAFGDGPAEIRSPIQEVQKPISVDKGESFGKLTVENLAAMDAAAKEVAISKTVPAINVPHTFKATPAVKAGPDIPLPSVREASPAIKTTPVVKLPPAHETFPVGEVLDGSKSSSSDTDKALVLKCLRNVYVAHMKELQKLFEQICVGFQMDAQFGRDVLESLIMKANGDFLDLNKQDEHAPNVTADPEAPDSLECIKYSPEELLKLRDIVEHKSPNERFHKNWGALKKFIRTAPFSPYEGQYRTPPQTVAGQQKAKNILAASVAQEIHQAVPTPTVEKPFQQALAPPVTKKPDQQAVAAPVTKKPDVQAVAAPVTKNPIWQAVTAPVTKDANKKKYVVDVNSINW